MFLLRSTPRGDLQHSLGAGVRLCHAEYFEPGARRFEREKEWSELWGDSGSPGGVVSIVLLGWEMLYLFNILPIRLTPR